MILKIDRSKPILKKSLLSILLILPFLAQAQQLTKYVDPFIGTGGHGHTYPGATVPFGMVQLSPDNGTQGWDWCSGYHYSDSMIAGFSHTHLTGTGIGDWCDISVMPSNGLIDDTISLYRQKFSHSNEKASPGYYAVKLDNGISAAFTATERCGLHQYIFPSGSQPVIRFDLGFAINWDAPVSTMIQQINDSTIAGYRYSKGWANNQRIYFAARTSVPFNKLYLADDKTTVDGKSQMGKKIKGQLVFADLKGKPLLMKVALSSTNMQKAIAALNEIKGWNFAAVKKSAENKWEKELQKITITSKDEQAKRIFYSALYHTCLAPVLYSDADGEYSTGTSEGTKKMPAGKQRYTEFSLWDTFRALNPLFTVTQPARLPDLINTMLSFYDETGLLPVWDLSSCETNCMTGYHAVPVVADAILKNVKGFNVEKAFVAMKKSAMQNVRGTDLYRQYGYIPQDKYGSSVTVTVEYAYDDWCIAQVAKKLGRMDDYKVFMERSASWKKLFDQSTGFIRAKNSDGNWVTPFDPYLSEHDEQKAMYTEGNAWQHSFFVPHDVKGLAEAHGSNEQFIKKLDSLFTVSSVLTGENASPDVSGLIGQYAHGNEPSHHIAYMYNYVGAAWKTQEKVRMIIDSMYHDRPDGYAGNEDCGQMSAWGVWSMTGIYPGNPSGGQYVFGSPYFNEVKFNLPGNKVFTIVTKNGGKDHPYIRSVRLNNKPYNKTYIDHSILINGGVLEFVMGDKPNTLFGKDPASWPASSSAN